MLLKKQGRRKASTALSPSTKVLWPPSPLSFGASSSKCSKFSSGGRDQLEGRAIPAGCPDPDHPVWALGSTVPLCGALQCSPHLPPPGVEVIQMLWGAPRCTSVGMPWVPVVSCPVLDASLVSKSFLPKVQYFFFKECMGHQNSANKLIWVTPIV